MTFMRHFHRLRWCRSCKDLTPHDELGQGLCMHCVWDAEDWIRSLDEKPVIGSRGQGAVT
jgi:hypothetical protein